jgi:hypothetical protein
MEGRTNAVDKVAARLKEGEADELLFELNVRLWPKADTQNLIIGALQGSAPERLLSTQSGR